MTLTRYWLKPTTFSPRTRRESPLHPAGRQQFLAALAYIRRTNPTAAARFRQRTEDVLRRLEQFPASGREIPEFPGLAYREIFVPPYRFFYRIQDQSVWVAALWHGAQLPEEPSP